MYIEYRARKNNFISLTNQQTRFNSFGRSNSLAENIESYQCSLNQTPYALNEDWLMNSDVSAKNQLDNQVIMSK